MFIDLIVVATAAAVLLLVAYSNRLFEENRTRVQRPRTGLGAKRPESTVAEPNAEGLVWRTLVGASVGAVTADAAHAVPSAPRRETVRRTARPAGEFVDIRSAA